VSERGLAVLDVDGVVADVGHRLHYLDSRPRDWAGFFSAAGQDPPLPQGVQLARTLAAQYALTWLTGRPEQLRAVTEDWFARHSLPAAPLHMRREGDRRPAALVKTGVLRQLARTGAIAVVVDDDPEVLAAVRAAGFPAELADWMPRSRELVQVQDREGRT